MIKRGMADDGNLQIEASQATFFNDTFSQAEVTQALDKINKEERTAEDITKEMKDGELRAGTESSAPEPGRLSQIQSLMRELL